MKIEHFGQITCNDDHIQISGFRFNVEGEGAKLPPDSPELAAAIVEAIREELKASLARGYTFGDNVYETTAGETYVFDAQLCVVDSARGPTRDENP